MVMVMREMILVAFMTMMLMSMRMVVVMRSWR